MKIEYVHRASLDVDKWEQCIGYAFPGLIYAQYWYLDIACEGHWDALIFDDYKAVMPLPWRRKFGIKYLYQPFFTQQLGIFGTLDPATFDNNKLRRILDDHFRLIDIQLNSKADPERLAPGTLKERINLELSLERTYEQISSGYNSQLKRNLKNATKHELRINKVENPGNIIGLFQSSKGDETPHLKEKDYERLLKLYEEAESRNMAFCWGIHAEGSQALAGGIFWKSGGRIINIFPAGNEQSRELAAMPFLLDRVIQNFAGRMDLLDFEGSMIPGVSRFYKGFGADEVIYWHFIRNNLPWWARWKKP